MENKQARWIWYRGDYALFHSLLLHSRREDRGFQRPTPWHLPTPYPVVNFYTVFTAERETTLCFRAKGVGRVIVSGISHAFETEFSVPAGIHEVLVELMKPTGLPALFVDSEYLKTDNTWLVSHGTNQRIHAGDTPGYFDAADDPEQFLFQYQRLDAVSWEEINSGILYDFGKELCAKIVISGLSREEVRSLTYGESREEALDPVNAVVQDRLTGQEAYRLPARAFRYLHISGAPAAVYADYEYLPLEDIGSFHCDNQLINRIWDFCVYTFHLNSREFFLDGIKRDRWVWSGDAYQSFMADYALYFDTDIVKRTVIALAGKPPYGQHVNTINDYTLYLIIALWEFYSATGDLDFVEFIFPRIQGLYDFTLNRLDEKGFVCQREGDWIFIDWSPMDKSGPLCAEQILLWKAHDSMGRLAALLGQASEVYGQRAAQLKENIDRYFWREAKGAYIDCYTSGLENVTRHANIFAILYDFVESDRVQIIVKNVLNNDAIMPITTPYFNLFQLMARCKASDMAYVQREIQHYWGGMLQLGATSVWEAYDPTKNGAEHYEMYGDKFGKSLCHAWGAGPIILLSRYCLGVTADFEQFTVHPNPGLFKTIQGTVPLLHGKVDIRLANGKLNILTTAPGGTVISKDQCFTLQPNVPFTLENYEF